MPGDRASWERAWEEMVVALASTMAPTPGFLEMLLELQTLDRVPRTGYLLRGVNDCESVTEHSWHLAFLVFTLPAEIPNLDRGRAVEIALVHDLAEVRIGDLPRSSAGYFPPGAKNQGEAAAVREVLAPLGERAQELYTEYQAGESPEARLVRACDKLQLLIKATVYEGWGARGLSDLWDNPDTFEDGGFAVVRRLFEALRRHRTEQAFGDQAKPGTS